MPKRLRLPIAIVPLMLSLHGGSADAGGAADERHRVTISNHTDACVRMRLFRDEGAAPTTPAVKQHDLAPRAEFSVMVRELPKSVLVRASVMSGTDCDNDPHPTELEGYARGGRVIIAGKKPRYVFISGALS